VETAIPVAVYAACALVGAGLAALGLKALQVRSKLAYGIGCLVAVGTSTAFAARLSPEAVSAWRVAQGKTPLEQYVLYIEEHAGEYPGVREWWRSQKGEHPQADAQFRVLTLLGVKRLDDAQLLRRGELARKLLEALDDETCGAMLRNRSPPEAFDRALGALSGGERRELARLTLASASAELQQLQIQHTEPQQADYDRFLRPLFEGAPPEEAGRAADALSGKANDADLCRAFKFLYARASTAPAETRVFVSYILSGS
jgi:hypothetical protein